MARATAQQAPAALEGVTVLDLSTVGPATRCSRLLADYGAQVVKVGAPPKKSGVQVRPAFWAYSAGRGMKQVRVDLKAPEGRDALLTLAEGADVWIESYRPGVAARLGIGWEDVRARNPRIVYCSTSGYGQTGPAAQWAGHDLNYLAVAGFLHTSGRRADGGPPLPGATVADGVLSLMSLYLDQHLATGEQPGPGHDILTGRYACYDTYRARDDRWLAVAAIEPHFYRNLCKALGCEQWSDHQLDDAVQDEIRRDFAAAFARRDRDAWVAELAPADTCVAPVNDIREVAADAQFAARGAFVAARHPVEGEFRQVSQVLAGMQPLEGPVAVRDGEHTDTLELLLDAGIARDALESMRRSGVIA